MCANKNKLIGISLLALSVPLGGFSQDVNWSSIDQGGGISTQGDISITGVIGQIDAIKMESGRLTVSGGYLPLPADLIFENQFD